MPSRSRSIAVLAGNPAFASILSHALEEAGDYRAPVFSTIEGLSTFLRIAPVDVAVLDLDLPWANLVSTARAIKTHPRLANPALDIIVLTRAVPISSALSGTSIAAVLGKPVTPQQLIKKIEALPAEPVRHHLQHIAPARPRPAPPTLALVPRHDNVIPLFGNRH
jgi:CheY-like chemotaxis protein